MLDYEGTVLLVSHDRTFMDNVVSSLLEFEGEGQITEYVGGYNDWLKDAKTSKQSKNAALKGGSSDFESRKQEKSRRQKQKKDLEKVTATIEAIEL